MKKMLSSYRCKEHPERSKSDRHTKGECRDWLFRDIRGIVREDTILGLGYPLVIEQLGDVVNALKLLEPEDEQDSI